jgi:hypothetical protein
VLALPQLAQQLALAVDDLVAENLRDGGMALAPVIGSARHFLALLKG